MKSLSLLALLIAAVLSMGAKEKEPVGVGDDAPAVVLSDENGKKVETAAFVGKRAVVLAFYPKDFTGG